MARFADSNRVSYRLLREDTDGFGVTPATGKPRELRHTGSKFTPKKDTKTSDEIRSDRMNPGIIEVGAGLDGDIKGEFSLGTYDEYIEAFSYALFTRPMTFDRFKGATVSVQDADEVWISGQDASAYFTVGRRAKLEGFLSEPNNRYVQIAAIAYDAPSKTTRITVTPAALVAEAGSAHTTFLDANDVIVLNSTSISADGVQSAFVSGGANAFAAAIAAKQLQVGQFIAVDGLGAGTGALSFGANAAAGDTVTVADGKRTVTFQIGGLVIPGRTAVALGADADETAANLARAIRQANVEGKTAATAAAAAGEVTVRNLNGAGGALGTTSAAITVEPFAGGVSSARGVFEIVALANDKITVSPNPGSAAAGPAVTVKGSMLRNPSDPGDFVPQSFTAEMSAEDVNQHFLYRGLRIGSFELTVSTGEIVGFGAKIMGTEVERVQSQASVLRAAPYTPLKATVTEALNATTNVGALVKNGAPLSTGIKSISFNGEANLREQRVIGSKFAAGIGAGRFGLSGKISAYFQDGQMFDHFIEHDTISLAFPFTDLDQNHIRFRLPAIKITSDPVSGEAGNADVMEEMDWEAQRDPTTDCMIQIDRFSSLRPVTA